MLVHDLKIGIIQSNAIIGDFPGNAKRLLAGYRACLEQGAHLVISPELSLIGYPPRDLIFKSNFVSKGLQALDYLASEIRDVPLLVGYIAPCESTSIGKPFYNAAAWLENGEIKHQRYKTLLPTYDVFDESRYFEPAPHNQIIVWNGINIGITICEDIWTADYLERPLYDCTPIQSLKDQGMQLLMNLSASPFQLGKIQVRQRMLSDLAQQYECPIVYCCAVGAQDSLIFDGSSLVFSSQGQTLAALPSFEESQQVISLSVPASTVIAELSEAEQIERALVLGLQDYMKKCGFTSVCLGLSGGIDSAVTAALACKALGAENVHGFTMPSPYSSSGSVEDSIALAKHLGMRCETLPIEAAFQSIKTSLAPVFSGKPEDVTEENIQARIRGLFLMAISNKENHLLLTTGNKSELAVGYCTIYGDMCGGLCLISDLPKTRVYELARWLNRKQEIIPWSTIEKAPSAELRPDQKDQDTLPPYEILDSILELYIEKMLSTDEIIAQGFDENTVRWIQRRVDMNEWKRQQSALGLKISSRAFGYGRRIPIAQRFIS